MNLMELFVKIGADTSDYEAGVSGVEQSATSIASKIGGGLATAAKVGTVAIAAVGTAAATSATAMVKGAADVAAYGDNIDKMSQKMGLSVEAYQEWDAVLQHSGTSIESMQTSMKTLANAAETGNEAFERLGITQEQLAEMSQQDLFEATIAGLQNVEDTTERTYLAGKLLGRGATELGALLNTSAEETQAMRDRLHELGGVMSEDAVKASAQFQDNLQDLQTTFGGIKNSIMADMLPGLNSLMAGFTSLLAGEDGAEEAIEAGIDQLFTNVDTMLDKAIEIGGKILPKIADGLIEHLPEALEMGLMIVEAIGGALIKNAPELIRSGLSMILTLAQSLIDSLPELIPAVVDIVLEIVETLTEPDTIVQLIDAALQLILALAEGLIAALPKLIEKAPIIVENLVKGLIAAAPQILAAAAELIFMLISGIIDGWSQIYDVGKDIVAKVQEGFMSVISNAVQWGKDLIKNFIAGITGSDTLLGNAVSGAADKIKSFLHFSEPDEGPLSDFHTYAPDMMKLFAEGIKDNENIVTDQIAKSFNFKDSIVADQPAVAVAGNAPAMAGGTFVIPVYIGGDKVDEKIISAIDAYNYRSGGR